MRPVSAQATPSVPRAEHPGGEPQQARRRVDAISLEIGQGRGRVSGKI
jgi:hypothetical protein